MSIKEHPPQHVPVLLEATLDLLKPEFGESYLDLTAGYGGHAARFLARTENYEDAVLVDRDGMATGSLASLWPEAMIIRSDFLSAAHLLIEQGRRFDIILVDLGVSSPQLDLGERGFSFRHDGPLDMRMDTRQALTAADLVNDLSLAELQELIVRYGEEKVTRAHRIAEAIVEKRPFFSTIALAETVRLAVGPRTNKRHVHPATRTFQALRIAVNDELRQLKELLPLIPPLLNSGGRVGIISFHSLEDRLVKQFFANQAASGYEGQLRLLTQRPLSGDRYDVNNPRARSAKLRAAVKK